MTGQPSETLPFLPVAINLRGKKCLVVGGGGIGTRKVETLLRSGARVTVVAPTVTPELAAHAEAGRLLWIQDSFREQHLADALLVIAATDDDLVNAAIVRQAGESRTLACDASSAQRSQVIFGALHQAEDTTIAVFTGGRDPSKARSTRDEIANLMAGARQSIAEPRAGSAENPPGRSE